MCCYISGIGDRLVLFVCCIGYDAVLDSERLDRVPRQLPGSPDCAERLCFRASGGLAHVLADVLPEEFKRALARELGCFGVVGAALVAVEAVPRRIEIRGDLRVRLGDGLRLLERR
jgi:hypothetical protein